MSGEKRKGMTKEEILKWYAEKTKRVRVQQTSGAANSMTKRVNIRGDPNVHVNCVVIGFRKGSTNVAARVGIDVMFLNDNDIEISKRVAVSESMGKPQYTYSTKTTLKAFQHGKLNIERSIYPANVKLGSVLRVTGPVEIEYNKLISYDAGLVSLLPDKIDLHLVDARGYLFPETDGKITGERNVVIPVINEADGYDLIAQGATFTMYAPPVTNADNFQFKTLAGDVEPGFVEVPFTATYMLDSGPEMVMVNMPMYAEQLKTLGITGLVKWRDLGPTIVEFWKGTIYGYIDWKKTRSNPVNLSGGSGDYKRVVEVRGNPVWDMRYILEHGAFKISAEVAKKMNEGVVTDSRIAVENYFTKNPELGIFNLSEYAGNKEEFFKHPERYTFYALTNLPRKDVEYIKEATRSDEDMLKILQDERDSPVRVRFNGHPMVEVFVVAVNE